MPTELSRRTLIALAGLTGALLAAGETISPANAAETWGYPFTHRLNPSRGWGGSYPEYTPNPGPHRGIDYPFGRGTPVHAVGRGTVVYAGWDTSQAWSWAGNHVQLRHPSGWTSFYAHLSALTVRTGDQIDLHTQVGNVGDTGGDWGNHLHLELWSSSSRSDNLDPYPYIQNAPLVGEVDTMTPEQYNTIIAKQDEVIFWVKQLGEALLNGRTQYGLDKRPVDLILDGVVETRQRVRGDVTKNYDILQDILSKVSK